MTAFQQQKYYEKQTLKIYTKKYWLLLRRIIVPQLIFMFIHILS